jgi:glycerate 2-kinase
MPNDMQPPSETASEAVFRDVRERVREMFDHALAECNVARAFGRKLQRESVYLQVEELVYDLGAFERALVVSIGKAGQSMAEAFANIINTELTGIVAAPGVPENPLPGFEYFAGGHPMPNQDSLRAGDAMLQLLHDLSPETLVIFLISGGASAIAEKPINSNIALADVIETYRALVHSGAPIAEINAVRKHLSALKGGRLARAAVPAQQLSLLVSDVPDNSPDALASGPTMADSTTAAECYKIANRYQLLDRFPSPVRSLFEGRQLQETPKAGDFAFARSQYVSVLSNATAVGAAVERAAMNGFAVEVDNGCDDWDYAQAADHLLSRLRELRQGVSRACLISGGEVTVKVGATCGMGGRNQQFALYCAGKIAGENITVLSAGTDGVDGNSPAAGAIADGSTIVRARQQGLDAAASLAAFDSHSLFHTIGDVVTTGSTGNNVRDLRILLAY